MCVCGHDSADHHGLHGRCTRPDCHGCADYTETEDDE